MRSVRGDELPDELTSIGSLALDVAAYRAWPTFHPFVTAATAELGILTGCYHDIAFRTGDCTPEASCLMLAVHRPLPSRLARRGTGFLPVFAARGHHYFALHAVVQDVALT